MRNGGGGNARRFVSARPWIVPVAVGFLLLLLGKSLAVLRLLVLLVGLVAAAGSRRARVGFVLRTAGVGQADYMDGTTFEHFSAEVLRSNGYHVEHVGQVADYGAGLIISNQSGRAVVQVKRYSGSVGVDAVREAAAARAHYGTHRAIVLTNSSFTPHAINLARSNAVDLWDRNVLVNLAGRNPALPPASAPAVFLAELGTGLGVIGR